MCKRKSMLTARPRQLSFCVDAEVAAVYWLRKLLIKVIFVSTHPDHPSMRVAAVVTSLSTGDTTEYFAFHYQRAIQ